MRTLSKLSRAAWTVRYLKARQIAGQVRHRVVHSFERYGNANGECVEIYPGCAWPNGVRFLAPGAQNNRADAIRQDTLEFLSAQVTVGFPPRWNCPELPKLWQYNLHYFEWLWALDYEDGKAVVLDWIRNHLLAKGAVGWESYPISLRLMNWGAVFWGRFRERTEADEPFLGMLWGSICRQAEWLVRHLETHLLGNHYLENGAALAVVGSCFFGEQARGWFGKGCGILRDQITEQILPDGMHFELSPMYHCRAIYVLAMLAATNNNRLRDLAEGPLSRMIKTLDHVCHPDGGIALLNDSAFRICNEPDELRSYGRHLFKGCPDGATLGRGCFALEWAGYYGWRDSDGTYVIADFGKSGPDHVLGHAHADIFSFELSVKGRRVIVDSGVYDYEPSSTRSYCRSTAAHNTVEIENQDQSEMWAAFRVARRGNPNDLRWEARENGFELSAWHDGYRRLPGNPVHSRIMCWDAIGCLRIIDQVSARRSVQAVSRLHLHPSCSIAAISPTKIQVARDDSVCTIESMTPLAIHESLYCPEFGVQQVNRCICAATHGAKTETRFSIHCPHG
jgi:uncharacterized heparinase superfamily protein